MTVTVASSLPGSLVTASAVLAICWSGVLLTCSTKEEIALRGSFVAWVTSGTLTNFSRVPSEAFTSEISLFVIAHPLRS